MKRITHLLIASVLGIAIGWALGFLRLPYLEKNNSFLLGFTAALAIVSLLLILLTARNSNFLSGLIGNKTAKEDSKSTRAYSFLWIMLLGVLVLGGIVSSLTVYRQNAAFKLQIQNQDKKLREMAALVEAVKKGDSAPLMRSILNDVGDDLKRNPGRTLRDTTIARIAAYSFALKPYKYYEGDSLLEQACSPERGQLLQALVLMNIDTGSFGQIIRSTLFAGADLRGADLKGLDLSGINLQEANLKDVDLSSAILKGADLSKANLWGAKLNRANLSMATLRRADLGWAQLNEAVLSLANLNGANLRNAQLRKANLNGAIFQWAQSGGVLFNEANLTSVNFLGTNLTKVNMSQANLDDADLRKINLSEAVLVGTSLDKAFVNEDWLDKLKEWRPIGVKELLENYSVVNDSIDRIDKRLLYHLRKKL